MKTVFVLGAGANKEIKLPTGGELKNEISRLLNYNFNYNQLESGDHLIYEAFNRICQNSNEDINNYIIAGKQISNALPQAISIDNYIDAHRGNKYIEICGKLAIVKSILSAEHDSNLNNHNNKEFTRISKSLENTWYNAFFQIITENCNKDEFKKRLEDITFIVFNYDRCLEYFMINSMRNYYSLSDKELQEMYNSITIYHPYGSVGSIDGKTSQIINFGEIPNSIKLNDLTKMIFTFTEGTNKQFSDIDKIQNSLGVADRIIFLGFAYHKQNLELLFSNQNKLKPTFRQKIYGTSMGISDVDISVVESDIRRYSAYFGDIKFSHKSCKEFFDEYRRNLSYK